MQCHPRVAELLRCCVVALLRCCAGTTFAAGHVYGCPFLPQLRRPKRPFSHQKLRLFSSLLSDAFFIKCRRSAAFSSSKEQVSRKQPFASALHVLWQNSLFEVLGCMCGRIHWPVVNTDKHNFLQPGTIVVRCRAQVLKQLLKTECLPSARSR